MHKSKQMNSAQKCQNKIPNKLSSRLNCSKPRYAAFILHTTCINLHNINGKVQGAVRGDYNNDGKEDLIIAVGAGKGFRDSIMQILLIEEKGIQPLWSESIGSNQIPDIHFVDNNIFFVQLFGF